MGSPATCRFPRWPGRRPPPQGRSPSASRAPGLLPGLLIAVGNLLLRFPSPANRPRRRLARISGAALCALAAAASAKAADLVPADPWQVIHVAREFGPASVDRDAMGDPQIRGSIDGLHYRIDFYGCRLGRDCDTILFDARFSRKEWDDEPPATKRLAEWNAEKLFGRAWRDDEGRAVLDHPVALADGVPRATLRAAFARWRTALTGYAGHLGIR